MTEEEQAVIDAVMKASRSDLKDLDVIAARNALGMKLLMEQHPDWDVQYREQMYLDLKARSQRERLEKKMIAAGVPVGGEHPYFSEIFAEAKARLKQEGELE